ncbi:hypothetical protein NNO04_22485, partial [Citrobacter sp. Awk 4]
YMFIKERTKPANRKYIEIFLKHAELIKGIIKKIKADTCILDAVAMIIVNLIFLQSIYDITPQIESATAKICLNTSMLKEKLSIK